MSNKQSNDHKHISLTQRVIIEKGLENNESFASIARKTGKDSSVK